ncbi:hypothetical protein ACFC1B_07495 [Streptomyces xiamenensis]|uniref:hypothetical protein n=1 Tax=Streptomyces xiamenensis TaxID=408015 RepID=UPI0035E104D1
MLHSADDEGAPAGVVASARPASTAGQVLWDWLEANIAVQHLLDYDGIMTVAAAEQWVS